MTVKLKPCPRCKAKPIVVKFGGGFWVWCRWCGFRKFFTVSMLKPTKNEAISDWNNITVTTVHAEEGEQ